MKLGELFVDLGVNAGNSLNTLTQFSIKFLAIKNMAQQMAGLFDEMFGGTARFGQGLYNQNLKLGMSVKLMQELANKEEQVGVASGTTLNSLKAIQKANADILQGQGNIKPYQKLGIDMSRLREPQELLDEIMQKILKLEPAFQRTMLAEFGLSEDLLVLWKQQGIKIREDLLLTQKDTSQLNELEKTAVALKQTFSGIFNKTVIKYAEDLTEGLKNIAHWMAENKEIVEKVVEVFGILLGAKMISMIVAWGVASAAALAPWLALGGAIYGIVYGVGKLMDYFDKKKEEAVSKPEYQTFKKFLYENGVMEDNMSRIPTSEIMNQNMIPANMSLPSNSFTNNDNSVTNIYTQDGPEAYKRTLNEHQKNMVGMIEKLAARG